MGHMTCMGAVKYTQVCAGCVGG